MALREREGSVGVEFVCQVEGFHCGKRVSNGLKSIQKYLVAPNLLPGALKRTLYRALGEEKEIKGVFAFDCSFDGSRGM